MKRLRLALVLVLLCSLAALPAPVAAPAATTRVGEGMMDAINWVRAQKGLRPLRRSRRLVRSSAARSRLMMRNNFFAHPSRLRVPSFDAVGEVLELHSGDRPQTTRVLRRWGNSSGHRSVIMSRRYRWIGAARTTGSFRGGRATIWVVRFGKK